MHVAVLCRRGHSLHQQDPRPSLRAVLSRFCAASMAFAAWHLKLPPSTTQEQALGKPCFASRFIQLTLGAVALKYATEHQTPEQPLDIPTRQLIKNMSSASGLLKETFRVAKSDAMLYPIVVSHMNRRD